MKSTGMVRKLDHLGRLVLPIELRRNLGIEAGDPIEFYVDGDKVILKKFNNSCVFCGEKENVQQYKDKYICKKCKDDLINKP